MRRWNSDGRPRTGVTVTHDVTAVSRMLSTGSKRSRLHNASPQPTTSQPTVSSALTVT